MLPLFLLKERSFCMTKLEHIRQKSKEFKV